MNYLSVAVFNIILEILLVIIIPIKIIKNVCAKRGKIKRIIILPFFILNWFLQAFLDVLFFKMFYRTLMYDAFAGFLSWLCDFCVFLLPVIACFIARFSCSDIKPGKVDVGAKDYQVVERVENTVDDVKNCDKQLFCRKCGCELLGNSRFCRKCGIEVVVEENNDCM